jgi:hypothetical protein
MRRAYPPGGQLDPSAVLWTVMYLGADGELRPYCPEYTAIPHSETRGLLLTLRASFPRERFCLKPHRQEHLTVAEGRKALRKLFGEGQRPELAKLAGRAKRGDLRLLTHIAAQAVREQERRDEWARLNEQRKLKGMKPIPRPAERRVDAQVSMDGGRLTIRMGGAF